MQGTSKALTTGYAGNAVGLARAVMLARDFALPLAMLAVALMLKMEWVIWGYVVGGQAHFILTYVYQGKGRKIDRSYLTAAFIILLGVLAYFSYSGAFVPLLLTVGILFCTHFAIDEITLHDCRLGKRNSASVALFVFLFCSLLFSVLFPVLSVLPLIASALFAVFVLLRVLMRSYPDAGERYLWFVGALIAVCAFLLPAASPLLMLGYVIWLHILNWSVGYGIRVRSTKREKEYWLWTLFITIVTVAAFVAYRSGTMVLDLVFGLSAYYAWAVAHILLSFLVSLRFRK